MPIAISTNSQRQTRKPRLVAVAPSRLRMSFGRLARAAAAPPERLNHIRIIDISRRNATNAMPMIKISVNHAGCFSGEATGVGVADCKKKNASSISGSYFAKADFDVTERDQIAFVNGVSLAIGDALS